MGTAKKARSIQRSIHLVASLMLLVNLYTPLSDNGVFAFMLRAMVVPVLVASGLAMWQWPRVRRILRARRSRRDARQRKPLGHAAPDTT